MLRFLLERPIAVITTLIACLSISVFTYFKLPISLLPSIDVPEIVISIRYQNGSPEEIETNILRPIRESMLTLSGLIEAESIAQSETGQLNLKFEYGTVMNLAYIEANEKIDRLTSSLPRDLERPIIIKTNTSDIPVIRIQVIPKFENDLLNASDLTTKVLKRRIEQIEGVGFVDINGLQKKVVVISPNYSKLKSLNLTHLDVVKSIEEANLDLGAVSVKDGNYRYFLKLATKVRGLERIGTFPVILPNSAGTVRLDQIALVSYEPEVSLGHHIFGGKGGVVINIHKQAQSRMPELMPILYKTVEQFKSDYPNMDFQLTQDQSLLLTYSIQNLTQSLILGGVFAFAILFLFMGGWREPLVMGIVLPLSLLLSFGFFHFLGLSLNIISISGLALGVGMLADNSIVIIDNISSKQGLGFDLKTSCVLGAQEVIAPLVSSALTNLAVFVPLIFLSGLTGALFYDQAISVAVILVVSIICTFIFVPLLYLLLFQNQPSSNNRDSRLYIQLKLLYDKSFEYVWQNKKTCLALMSLLLPLTFTLFILLPKQGFPEIERTETLVSIDWNEPIDAEEGNKRVTAFINDNAFLIKTAEAEAGYQQFLLNNEKQSVQHAEVYIEFPNEDSKKKSDGILKEYLQSKFPNSVCTFSEAPNAFEQMFSSDRPLFEARFRDFKSKKSISGEEKNILIQKCSQLKYLVLGKGFHSETILNIKVDFINLNKYGVSYSNVVERLKVAFGNYSITNLTNFGEVTPVVFNQEQGDIESTVARIDIKSINGKSYPLRQFIKLEFHENLKNITADASGIYQAVNLSEVKNEAETENEMLSIANSLSLNVDFTGEWFTNEKHFKQLILIVIISVLLMYFILTAEFESITQPLLVILTIPMGFAGSLLLLWLSGDSINIMSGIGFIVVLGIMDNDAILKIDRINTLRKELTLENAIRQAGHDRFKPIVMNTFTNILAITPIIFSSGLGADLQRPVAIATIGGLFIGTITALYFIPLMYWFLYKRLN